MSISEIRSLDAAKNAITKILNELPQIELSWDRYAHSDHPDLTSLVDFTVEAKLANYSYNLAVETAEKGHPRQLRAAIDRLLRFRHRSHNADFLVVAAPFITAAGAAVCAEERVGYFDYAGNCRLVFGTVFVERTGHANPVKPQQLTQAQSLYAPKCERVLRALLFDPQRTWKVIPLAQAASTSLGTVSVVRQILLEQEWARKNPEGLKLTRARELIQDWAAVAQRRRVPSTGFFGAGSLIENERALAKAAKKWDCQFALTGLAGAWHRAPMTRYHSTTGYCDIPPAALAESSGLKPAASGANVHLLKPRDSGVFVGQESIDGVPVVSSLQLYLDLQREKARGQEAADHIMETELLPRYAG
jgi:hypothetical protein